ncbi:MAG TPA: glycoside hydrolase family 2 TIM barrel-domain containing protein [Haloplasmataceae bacterium]
MRRTIPLNFDWRFVPDFREEYIQPSFNDATFETIDLPHSIKEMPLNNFNEEDYQFVACYRKAIHLEEKLAGHRYLLVFEGVGHVATVYLNGAALMTHYGGYTPFQVDITDSVQEGANTLVVAVDSRSTNNIPPFGGTIDYLTFGGIYREVSLVVVPDQYIENVFIQPFDVLTQPKAKVHVTLSQAGNFTVYITFTDPNGKVIQSTHHPMTGLKDTFVVSFDRVELWDIDHPHLYEVTVQLKAGEIAHDRVTVRTGFRDIRFTKNGFYLNGRKVKIKGINRHQMYPYVGYAMPKSVQKRDAEIIRRELGFNLVRTSHYPQSKHFLNACDELGLLVFEEIPGWQYVGDATWQAVLKENLKEMIIRDRNHPCIILWGVRVNESGDMETLYRETNAIAKTLDPSRPTGGVRCFKGSQLLEDVYTYNDFSLTTGDVILQKVEDVIGDSEAPYLVTEYLGHTFPTKRFDREARQLEHALRHALVFNEYLGCDRIAGGIAWSMNDYNTHEDFGSGDKVCYHGILDMFRLPKLAAYTYKAENTQEPFIRISTNFDIGEYDGSFIEDIYVFTNCDYIEILRNGHSIGYYYPDRETFPHMEHPPIKVSDLFGNLLVELEGFDEETAEKIKAFTRQLARIGGLDKITEKERAYFNDPQMDERAWDLYGKYVANWGQKRVNYTIKGYIDGKMAAEITIGRIERYALKVTPDQSTLRIEDTYDATRIVVEEIGDKDNVVQWGFDPLHITTSEHLEVIGPSLISLVSGKVAFWVKTTGKIGTGTVTIYSPKYGNHEVKIKVVRG